MTIPVSEIVRVTPGVLLPGGNELSLNCIMLTTSDRVPVGVVQAFATLADVQDFFGPASIEATLAGKYFAGFVNALTLPGTLYFAQYNTSAVEAYLRSGSFAGASLAQIQALSGTLIVSIDGRTITTPSINLSSATSFTNAAALIQAGLQSAGTAFTGTATISDGSGGAGNILNVTAVASGSLKIGDVVVGGPNPATITALGTGTGGIGTYTVGGAAQDFDPGGAITVASTATASYDSQLAEFLIHSPTTGDDSTIGYATGTLAAGIKFTSATGAVLSQGAAIATPAEFMPGLVALTQNWATFMTVFEPETAEKLEFVDWVQTTNQRYMYVAWDTDVTPLAGAAPAAFAPQCVAAEAVGVYPQWELASDVGNGRKAAFIAGAIASIDFNQANSRITLAFKQQAGLLPDVSNATEANNLILNGYNFYGSYGAAAEEFVFERPGSTPGPWVWADPYINQIWLNSVIQSAIIRLLLASPVIPYNTGGYSLFRQTIQDPINRALTNGVIQTGVTLSQSQRQQINTAASTPGAADAVFNNGFFLLIQDAPPEVRAVRGSPPMRLWYADGGSIQEVNLASIAVQ